MDTCIVNGDSILEPARACVIKSSASLKASAHCARTKCTERIKQTVERRSLWCYDVPQTGHGEGRKVFASYLCIAQMRDIFVVCQTCVTSVFFCASGQKKRAGHFPNTSLLHKCMEIWVPSVSLLMKKPSIRGIGRELKKCSFCSGGLTRPFEGSELQRQAVTQNRRTERARLQCAVRATFRFLVRADVLNNEHSLVVFRKPFTMLLVDVTDPSNAC